eukprot:7708579-Alexandrium_andersonii.AAC.1
MPAHVVDLSGALGPGGRPFARVELASPHRLLQRRQPETTAPGLAGKAGTGRIDAPSSRRQA